MRRIRLLRIALPLALVSFLVFVALSRNERPVVHGVAGEAALPAERYGRGIDLKSLQGERTVLDASAGLVEPRPDGGYHLERIERLAVARTDRGPLVVERAAVADVEGAEGARRIRVRDEVVVRDPQEGLRLTLPWLDVDEAAGEAVSRGAIGFEGGGMRGGASGVVYGLKGQPSRLLAPQFTLDADGQLQAAELILWDGLDDIEFDNGVSASRGQESFRAGTLRLWRDAAGHPLRAEARGGIRARIALAPPELAQFAAASAEAGWRADGEVERLRLVGEASVSRPGQAVAASTIEAVRDDQGPPWLLRAAGKVHVRGAVGTAPAWLRAELLEAELGAELELRVARVEGQVQVESDTLRAEADRAEFDPTAAGGGSIRMFGVGPRKARVARDRQRVAARRITTDARGTRLVAEERVEATLLPVEEGQGPPPTAGLFRPEQAIHFVAATLIGEDGGAKLLLRQGVRGWQGERNLSAEELEMDERARTLHARGGVTTRIPRDPARASGEYVQVAADRLDYDERGRLGVYSGGSRVSVTEGWLEAERVEIRLTAGGSGVEELWARGNVRVEFRAPAEDGGPPQLYAGTGDRLEYRPAERTVRLYGDTSPAAVRRLGAEGVTTTGRVLYYRFDLGTLEVDPGDGAPARIRGR